MKSVDLLSMPVIGITAGEVQDPHPGAAMVYGQGYNYCEAVVRAGGAPLIIPLTTSPAVLRRLYDLLDAILFAGGDDVNPARYGEAATSNNLEICDRRDEVELTLMNWALQERKPLLAICRGLQLLNVASGGNLYQDIAKDLPEADNHKIADKQRLVHQLEIEPGSKLAAMLETDTIATNSHHYQAIKVLGNNLKVVARSSDGIVEAVEAKNQPFAVGIQSHPESLAAELVPAWQGVFNGLVASAVPYSSHNSQA